MLLIRKSVVLVKISRNKTSRLCYSVFYNIPVIL